MKRLLAGLIALGSLCAAPVSGAGPLRYGVADDWPEWHACGDVWWQAAKDIGYQDLRLTVKWDETQPAVIPEEDNIRAAVSCALLSGMRPILAVYPLRPTAIGSDRAEQTAFASFVADVGSAFPDVTNVIVGNEPNVNRFWQPQYRDGKDAAAIDYEHTLAAAYDALKAVRPDALVWGPAVSSRGNDDPDALSNPSHSPVWFIKHMGNAYRVSGRRAPIFDEFDLHPYPAVQDTAAFSRPFPWPGIGAADLDRLKQVLWDSFHGTGQPVPAEYGRSRAKVLPINLDEVGEQTTLAGHDAGFTNATENVAPIDEATQARRYVQLVRAAACDPDVMSVMFFPLIDEVGVADGFQSGELYVDLTKKFSYGALKNEIATSQGLCLGSRHRWVHTNKVVGAAGIFGGVGAATGSQPRDKPHGAKKVRVAMTAAEDATFRATLVPATGRRVPAGARVASARGAVHAYRKPVITITGPIPPGRYRIQVVVTAATNPDRTTTLTSRPFTVGSPVKRRKQDP